MPVAQASSYGKTHLRDQNLVTRGDAGRDSVAVLVEGTRSNCQDLSLVELLDAALRKEDAGGSLILGLYPLDQDTVQEGSKVLDVAEGLHGANLLANDPSPWHRRASCSELRAGKVPSWGWRWVCAGTYHFDGWDMRRTARLQ